MSLVNQMLRDLEARREREEAATPRIDVRAVGARRRATWWPLALAGVIVAVGAAAYMGSFVGKRVHRPEFPSSSPVLASQAKASERATPRGDVIPDKQTTSTGRVKEAAAPVQNATGQAADFARPVGDKAAKGEPEGDASRAAGKPDHPKARIAAAPEAPAQPATVVTKQPAPKPDAVATVHPRMNKTPHPPTPAERAAAAYAAGVEAAQNGQIARAEARFGAALDADPTAYGARQALAALLDRQGRAQEAMQVFITGMQADPAHRGLFARLYARLLVAHDQISQAISVLKDNLPTATDVPEHYAFLAALLEREGDHEAAIANYMKALTVRPGEGRWWAGVAVSYEQSREPDRALAAYRRARRAGGLGVTLATYVNKRIDVLTP